jgi:Reverse transcriptase (RNA-dependent DNA polymerase)
LCVDYRALNKLTVKNWYPLPQLDDLLDQFGVATIFSSLDLAQNYHQIQINPDVVPTKTFRTPFGHYEYKVLLFGLTNAPATFQAIMNDIFREHLNKFVLVYMDDILIYSKSAEEHKKHLRIVLQILRSNRLYAKLSKCRFGKCELNYFGHVVSKDGLRVGPRKIEGVTNSPRPRDVGQVRSFLGHANYFRKIVQGYSVMVAPFTDLTKKNLVWDWTDKCEEAFEAT